jgi:hypothetical protein
MQPLKNSVFYFLLFILNSGCATTHYNLIINENSPDEVHATSDRFLTQCEQIDTMPNRYGFMVHFLDDANTVATAAGMITDKKTCQKWENEIQNILTNGNSIVLKGDGYMISPREKEKFVHTFPKHGTFHGNGRGMQFFKMTNENGGCFVLYHNTCP